MFNCLFLRSRTSSDTVLFIYEKKKIRKSCQDAVSHLQSQCPKELLQCGSAAKCWQATNSFWLKRHVSQL